MSEWSEISKLEGIDKEVEEFNEFREPKKPNTKDHLLDYDLPEGVTLAQALGLEDRPPVSDAEIAALKAKLGLK